MPPHYLDAEHQVHERASALAHSTRYHRKVLVLLAVLALVVVYRVREGLAVPFLATVVSDVSKLSAWARSTAGSSFLCTLVGFIALDIAVDMAYRSWSSRQGWRY